MQDAGSEGPLVAVLLRHAVAPLPVSAARASAEVWTVLWHITQLTGSNDPGTGIPS
ncbi:hypothetical protein GCM10010289_01390 [Streptomyces violascens]|nr:hypothetical protein GCM10010289_01390 [Streptomyces violascens]